MVHKWEQDHGAAERLNAFKYIVNIYVTIYRLTLVNNLLHWL